MLLEHNIDQPNEDAIITAKGLRRSSYMALWLILLLALVVTTFEPDLNRWLSGQLSTVSLLLAALIFMITNSHSIHRAQRPKPLGLDQPTSALALIIESHLLLDTAIVQQLNGIVTETEHAAMTIISAARNISLHADMLRTMIDQTGTAHDLLAAVHDGNRQLSANITEILGQVQFQDVVRQRVERAILSMQQRNVVFKEMLQSIELSGLNLIAFADNMRTVLEQYLQNEKLHAAALHHASDQDAALPKIEFF